MKNLKEISLLTLNHEFFSTFVTVAPTRALASLVKGKKVENFDFNVKVSEEPRSGVGSREHFGNVVRKVIPLSHRRHDCEVRNKSSVGSHKPDYVQRSLAFAGEQGIVTLGEIKGIMDADREFSDEDVGQVLDFLQELLIKQCWRQWVFGFLTDGIRFEFFRGMRRNEDGRVSFTRSGLLSKGNGWSKLSQLLQQSDEVLGFSVIIVAGWQLGSSLGSGATTSVFVATSNDAAVDGAAGGVTAVCKIFTGARATASRDNEMRALRLLADDPHTPKIAADVHQTTSGGELGGGGGEQSYPVLVVTPLGEALGVHGVRLPIHAYAPLVDTLLHAHNQHLCHIDVSGDNMFAVRQMGGEGYEVLLNDWASSMTYAEVETAEKFFTHALYYDVARMGPSEDLTALVRSVFVLTQCTFSRVQTAAELDQIMRQQWSWGVALERARASNYDAIRQFFLTGSCDTVVALTEALANTVLDDAGDAGAEEERRMRRRRRRGAVRSGWK